MRDNSTRFDFSEALLQAKNGGRIARAGWNGRGMYVWLGRCSPNDIVGTGGPGLTMTNPECRFFCMKAADGSVVVGWLASQTDMLAEDWEVV